MATGIPALKILPNEVAIREIRVETGRAELFVRVAGASALSERGAEVLIVAHGGPGISHEYLEGLEDLAGPKRAVVSYDQRGVGRSSGAVDPTNVIREAVCDLDRVRAALGVERAHLLGHSYGGLLAAVYGAEHRDRTASITLIDSIPPTSVELDAAMLRYRARLGDYQSRGLVPVDLPTWEEDARGRFLAILPSYFLDPRHPGARSLNGASLSGAVWQATQPALRAYDFGAQLRQVNAPVLSVLSSVPFGFEMGATMATALPTPGSRSMPLRAGGHFPWVECPTPFFEVIRSFLADACA